MSRPSCYQVYVCPTCTESYKYNKSTSWIDGGTPWCNVDRRLLYRFHDRIFSCPKDKQHRLLTRLLKLSKKLYEKDKDNLKWLSVYTEK